jgi:hypothetical protein
LRDANGSGRVVQNCGNRAWSKSQGSATVFRVTRADLLVFLLSPFSFSMRISPFANCVMFLQNNEVRNLASRRGTSNCQCCNPAATDLFTFAKTLRAVQLKKSMSGIPREYDSPLHRCSTFGAKNKADQGVIISKSVCL